MDLNCFLLTILVAILAPAVFCNYLLTVLNVSILSAKKRCEIIQYCQWVEDLGQRHYGLSFTQLGSIAFLIIPYIAQRPICTFLAIGPRLLEGSLISQILPYIQWVSFLSWITFFMILDLLLFHMLYFIINYSAHTWFPTLTTAQGNQTWQLVKKWQLT